MNPDFDSLLWTRGVGRPHAWDTYAIELTAHVSGEHITHDGRLCCRGKAPVYEIMVAAYDHGKWAIRKLSEIPL
jgi:hypothetical protein